MREAVLQQERQVALLRAGVDTVHQQRARLGFQ
jgi:hypothetical protein